MSEAADATIVGAGPAGVACALLMQRAGMRARLIARRGYRPRPPELIAPSTARRLRALGVDMRHLRDAARACRWSTSAWSDANAETFDYQLFMCEPAQAVDRAALDAVLFDRAHDSGVECIDASIVEHGIQHGRWTVRAAGSEWRSRYLVDATGKQGLTAASRQRQHSDRLVAVHSPWPVMPPEAALRIEAMQDGWWYAVPSPGGGGHMVCMTDFDQLPRDRATRTQWLEVRYRRAGAIRDGSSACPDFAAHKALDARSSRASHFVGEQLLVLGDAAWSNDPLSGQGISRAIEQAERAVLAVCEGSAMKRDSLQAFGDWCEAAHARSEQARLRTYGSAAARFPHHAFWARRSQGRVA